MKIAIDLQACQSPGSRQRGIGRYSLELARALVRNRGEHRLHFLLNAAFDAVEAALRETLAPNAVIIDEFGAHLWTGADVPQRWLDDYGKDATASGITGGRVDYAAPIRASAHERSAYIVLPTIYRFQQAGMARSAAGTMTFVMTKVGNEWKIAAWTYSAPAPK